MEAVVVIKILYDGKMIVFAYRLWVAADLCTGFSAMFDASVTMHAYRGDAVTSGWQWWFRHRDDTGILGSKISWRVINGLLETQHKVDSSIFDLFKN